MAESLAQLESDLENLNKAIRAGIMMVQIGGQLIKHFRIILITPYLKQLIRADQRIHA